MFYSGVFSIYIFMMGLDASSITSYEHFNQPQTCNDYPEVELSDLIENKDEAKTNCIYVRLKGTYLNFRRVQKLNKIVSFVNDLQEANWVTFICSNSTIETTEQFVQRPFYAQLTFSCSKLTA